MRYYSIDIFHSLLFAVLMNVCWWLHQVVAQENADYIVFVEQYRTNQRALLAAKQKEEMTSALQRNLEILAQARRDVNAEYNRTLKSFDIRKDILSHKQTLEMSQRPLVAPAPHQVAALLAATSAGQKTQKAAKQGGDYSLARIHDFNNNELTSQQFTQLSRNAFKTPDAQERQQALLKTLGEANFEAAEFDLVANFRESTMVEGSQSSRSNASSQWRVASSGWHTRREPISGESEPASSGEKNSHASHPNLPAPQSLPTSFPVKMATRPQPLNISRSRPLSALSLVSRAKEGKLNSTSMLGELTARSAMNTGRAGTSLMQTQAAAKEKSGDVIARPSSSLRGTMNTPTSNRLLAF
jgi:hypothetical protein